MYHKPTRVRFGAAYYHEYQRVDRLKTDLDLMAEASFSVIRVGESVWVHLGASERDVQS
jgi:beta-galactosidase